MMNAHPHEVDMNMAHQHDVKMTVHTHEYKVNIPQNHEIKMQHQHENSYHDLVDSKSNMQLQHDVKMVSHHDMKMMNPSEVKILQNEVIHPDVKMNHHEVVVHQEVPAISQHHHMMELHLQPVQQIHTEVENSDPIEQHQRQETRPDPPPKKKISKAEKLAAVEAAKKKKEAIDGQAREIIFKVIKFFETEKQNRGYAYPVENVIKRACAATGLSESTIKRIKRDGLRAEATQTRIQGPKKKRVRKTKVQLDYFQLCALKGIVNSYNNRKEIPTLGKILAAAKHELNYRGGKESLRLILLNKLGIKFKKLEKKNKKPPEEQQQQQPPQIQTMMPQQQMQHMKVMENQTVCGYGHTNMIPPVSY